MRLILHIVHVTLFTKALIDLDLAVAPGLYCQLERAAAQPGQCYSHTPLSDPSSFCESRPTKIDGGAIFAGKLRSNLLCVKRGYVRNPNVYVADVICMSMERRYGHNK